MGAISDQRIIRVWITVELEHKSKGKQGIIYISSTQNAEGLVLRRASRCGRQSRCDMGAMTESRRWENNNVTMRDILTDHRRTAYTFYDIRTCFEQHQIDAVQKKYPDRKM